MSGLKLIHVSKRGYWCHIVVVADHLTDLGLVTQYGVINLYLSLLVQVIVCHLFSIKPLPKLMLTYHQLDHIETNKEKNNFSEQFGPWKMWHHMNWQLYDMVHYSDVIMNAMVSQITGISIVHLTVFSGSDQRKHQSSASSAFVRGIHRSPVDSPHKGPVTRKIVPFDDVIMRSLEIALKWMPQYQINIGVGNGLVAYGLPKFHEAIEHHKGPEGSHSLVLGRCGSTFNTLRPRQNGRHVSDDIFKCIFLNENVWILLKIWLKFVPKVWINNIPALVQIMAWRRPGDKPLSEPMMV